MPLILDEEGRTVDSSGRTVQLSIKHSTAQVLKHCTTNAEFLMLDKPSQEFLMVTSWEKNELYMNGIVVLYSLIFSLQE